MKKTFVFLKNIARFALAMLVAAVVATLITQVLVPELSNNPSLEGRVINEGAIGFLVAVTFIALGWAREAWES